MKKKLPPIVYLLGLVSFFNDIASEMLYPVMPIFLTQVLGAPVFVVGIIDGVAEGISSFLKTVFGVWSDRLQKRKPFAFSGYALSGVAKVIIAFAYTWPVVFLGRITDRFGKGVRTGARDAMLLEASEDGNKGLVFGFHRAMDSAGAVVGPLISLFLLTKFNNNIRLILLIATVPTVFSLALFFFIREAKKKVTITKTKLIFFSGNIPKKLKFFFIVLAIFSIGNSTDSFLILRAKNIGMSLTMVVLAYVVYNIVYTLLSAPAGELADRWGAKKVFILGLLIFSIVYGGFAFTTSSAMVWVLFAAYGAYIALTDGVSKAYVGGLIHKEESGTAYGVMQTVISVSTLLASVLGGFIWTAISPQATFMFGAACALIALVLFVVFDR